MAQKPDPKTLEAHAPTAPKPGPEHEALSVFVGKRRIEGRNLDGAPDKPGADIEGEGDFEYLPGDFFVHGRESVRFAG